MKTKLAIAILILVPVIQACSVFPEQSLESLPRIYGEPIEIGVVESSSLVESSGLASSRCTDDLYWSHNDSGESPTLFALDSSGRNLGEFLVSGAENVDWEDIATAKNDEGCEIYISDTGNNYGLRKEFAIYLIQEPLLENTPIPTLPLSAKKISFSYDLLPDETSPDAEAMIVHPVTKEILIITKEKSGPAEVYVLSESAGKTDSMIAKKIGEVVVPSIPPGLITGGDISPDGKRLVLVDYLGAYEFSLPDLKSVFPKIFEESPTVIRFGKRTQGESIAYTRDGASLLATSEGLKSPIVMVSAINK